MIETTGSEGSDGMAVGRDGKKGKKPRKHGLILCASSPRQRCIPGARSRWRFSSTIVCQTPSRYAGAHGPIRYTFVYGPVGFLRFRSIVTTTVITAFTFPIPREFFFDHHSFLFFFFEFILFYILLCFVLLYAVFFDIIPHDE